MFEDAPEMRCHVFLCAPSKIQDPPPPLAFGTASSTWLMSLISPLVLFAVVVVVAAALVFIVVAIVVAINGNDSGDDIFSSVSPIHCFVRANMLQKQLLIQCNLSGRKTGPVY